MFTKKDIEDFKLKGIETSKVEKQLEFFRKGMTPVKLHRPATPDDGIETFNEGGVLMYAGIFDKYAGDLKKVKFIPASGAATRMFKDLHEVYEELQTDLHHQKYRIDIHPQIKSFFKEIYDYPFIENLKEVCRKNNKDLSSLIKNEQFAEIIHLILSEQGLNYSNTPKGALEFHKYSDSCRNPVHEHLIESEQYLINPGNSISLHFTVSPEHMKLFQNIRDKLVSLYKNRNIHPDISFSVQDPSTDTIAVDFEDNPFRDEEGNILFRPGGHGALLKNLENLDQDLIFISNIDNVSPDRSKPLRVLYKKLLGGYLIEKLGVIRELLLNLEERYSRAVRNDILSFVTKNISKSLFDQLIVLNDEEFKIAAFNALNRPVRVCGMVKNTGEPGGGPFWISEENGLISKQIIESSQINMSDPDQKKIFMSSTHFNPVDIVCSIRDYKGEKFRLSGFRDDNMAFISKKSAGGRNLKALELPGLWNGGMAGWLTFFIDVPTQTFTPVKTVFDLMRPEHRESL